MTQRSLAPDGRPDAEQPAWRQDFPVDVPQDQYVSRREFTKFLGLTSLGFVVGQLWILLLGWFSGRQTQPRPQEIARLSELKTNEPRPFAYPGPDDTCILLPLEDGSFVAYDQKCTHLSCAVVPDPAQGCLHCPCHRGNFDYRTGRPISGPPRRPLTRITLEVRDGAIWATGVERRTI